MAPVMPMAEYGRSLVAEEPAIVFSVKELISRLDGKLDLMMNVLTGKADRADVNNLEHRVGAVELKVSNLTTEKETEGKAEEKNVTSNRFLVTVLGTLLALLIAAISVVVTLLIKG
jgi:hypothetical protein